MTPPTPRRPLCGYTYVDTEHMFGPFDLYCREGMISNRCPDGTIDHTDQPCPRCHTAAAIARILANIHNVERNEGAMFPHNSAAHWSESIRTPLGENHTAALLALQALGPMVFQDIPLLQTTQRLAVRLWPWPLDGLSAHAHLPLMAIAAQPQDHPPMPLPYAPGDTGKAYCGACTDIVATTFGLHDVPLSDGSGVVPSILAATCDHCGAVVAIPAQSTPAIKAFHEAAQQGTTQAPEA